MGVWVGSLVMMAGWTVINLDFCDALQSVYYYLLASFDTAGRGKRVAQNHGTGVPNALTSERGCSLVQGLPKRLPGGNQHLARKG